MTGSPTHEPSGPAADAVQVEVVIAEGAGAGRGRLSVLRLGWWPADPLAVELLLTAQPDHPALPRGRWVVLRDFLRYGCEQATGDGEVRIHPDDVRDRVWLDLPLPGRAACFSVDRATLIAFLDATERVVACGQERSAEALDALLARLLSGQ